MAGGAAHPFVVYTDHKNQSECSASAMVIVFHSLPVHHILSRLQEREGRHIIMPTPWRGRGEGLTGQYITRYISGEHRSSYKKITGGLAYDGMLTLLYLHAPLELKPMYPGTSQLGNCYRYPFLSDSGPT